MPVASGGRATVAGVADDPSWRQGYDALERQVGPRLEQLVRSEPFAVAVGLLARVQRGMEQESGRMTRRVLHRLNLPAGTDVTRILNEIGQLRRQVHELTLELDDARTELAEARATATRPPAKRAPAKRAPAKKAPAKKTAAKKTSATKRGSGRGRARS